MSKKTPTGGTKRVRFWPREHSPTNTSSRRLNDTDAYIDTIAQRIQRYGGRTPVIATPNLVRGVPVTDRDRHLYVDAYYINAAKARLEEASAVDSYIATAGAAMDIDSTPPRRWH